MANTQDPPARRPNVLWIGVDQMRADTPGFSGNTICQTPHLDSLAAQGVVFEQAYTPCSLCTPARASMLTGLFAFQHGMGTNCDMYQALARELPDPDWMLTARLPALGYRCGYTGKWHIGARLGPREYGFEGMSLPGYGDLKQSPGYRAYLQEHGLRYGPPLDPIYANPGAQTLVAGRWNGPLESTPTHYLTEATLQLLEAYARQDAPFFLTCQYWAPHGPYLPAPEFAGLHDRRDIPPWINFRDPDPHKPAFLARRRNDFYRSLPQEWAGWREIVGLCYDYTAQLDAEIGRLLARLEQLGLADNTLVIFTSDHGDMAGSHGGLFDKGFLYQEAQRIPLVLRWPRGFSGGVRAAQLVYNMDILPTLLDILHMPDEALAGRSLLPYLKDPALPGREAIYLEFHGLRYLFSQRALVTRAGRKYIFTPGDRDEVYDLNADPGELHNLLAPEAAPGWVESLRQELIRTASQLGDPLQDYIAKIHGDWEVRSGQMDASASFGGYSPGG